MNYFSHRSHVARYKLKFLIEAAVTRLGPQPPEQKRCFIFLRWGRREGRDNRRDDDWLSKVEWEFVSQSEAVFGLNTNHTASYTQTSKGELQ